jgi:hypothetical protein
MTVAAMLSREGRQWGDCADNDGKEEVVEVELDDNDETVAALGGGGRQKGGFKESSRRTARPTAPKGWMGAVTTKSTKICRPPLLPPHRWQWRG